MKKIFYLASLIALMLTSIGCISQIRPFDEYVAGWVGKPVADLIVAKQRPGSFASKSGWKEKRYVLANGNWVYVSPEKAECLVHWEINSQDIIAGYHVEGRGCDWR